MHRGRGRKRVSVKGEKGEKKERREKRKTRGGKERDPCLGGLSP